MPTPDEILKHGLISDEPAPDTLAKLFALKDWDGTTGRAFVGVCYPRTLGNPNGSYGAQIVRQERLEDINYTVVRMHNGFLHIKLEERPTLDLRFKVKGTSKPH